MIQSVYQGMWKEFEQASKHNEYKLDPFLIEPKKDNRRGITALAYLNQGNKVTLSKILTFQDAIRMLEPDQYFHPADELHLTILSIISCLANFQLSDIKHEIYKKIFQSVFKDIKPIKIHYRGITASKNCIVIQGFPIDDTLDKVRNVLRDALKKESIMLNFDARYKLVTAHSSAIRLCRPVQDSQALFKLCESYRNHDFGYMQFAHFELVFNNFYQNLSVTKSLSRITI